MKNILKGSIVFVVGVAIGVAGSYKFFEKKFGDIADAEIESIKMVAKNNRMKAEVGVAMHGEDIDGDMIDGKYVNLEEERRAEKQKQEDLEEQKKMTEEYRSYNELSAAYKAKVAHSMSRDSVQKVNYSDMSENIDEENIGEDNRVDRRTVDLSGLKPIVISAEAFVQECLDYDKLTLNYYAVDGVLLDDHGDAFEDYEDYVGYGTMDQFGAFGVGDNLLYVRNDKFESDYEIVKFDESYV